MAWNQETFPEVNFVRFAIPRLRYERDDLEAVAKALHLLYQRRQEIPPLTVTYGKDLPLRHCKGRFAFAPSRSRPACLSSLPYPV